ncbi:MAG: hypothetical protein JWO13_1126 [Acidobacteriales bacterium]|nr:hypothetical protein [Terriglobales bacterium]
MAITVRQLAAIRRIESLALRKEGVSITKRQAHSWCAVHVAEDWYTLPVMLMSKGCNADYTHWTEIAPDSVYELDDTGCYIELADWWTSYQLWRRDGVRGNSLRPRNPDPAIGSRDPGHGSKKLSDKIELYDEGEYCEDLHRGQTCLDRDLNTQTGVPDSSRWRGGMQPLHPPHRKHQLLLTSAFCGRALSLP